MQLLEFTLARDLHEPPTVRQHEEMGGPGGIGRAPLKGR
jgi:hypothetical protein